MTTGLWCSQAEINLDAALARFITTASCPRYVKDAYTAWLADQPAEEP